MSSEVPTGAATQRILYWQNKTIQMMYETIYKALVEAGLENAFSPQDYLIFFCLGNREAVDGFGFACADLPSPTGASTPQAQSRKIRWFMIYVHSKGMIVDDEYVILGVCKRLWKVQETRRLLWEPTNFIVHGQKDDLIHKDRMSLWAEHLGTVECFIQADSLECVRRVRTLSAAR